MRKINIPKKPAVNNSILGSIPKSGTMKYKASPLIKAMTTARSHLTLYICMDWPSILHFQFHKRRIYRRLLKTSLNNVINNTNPMAIGRVSWRTDIKLPPSKRSLKSALKNQKTVNESKASINKFLCSITTSSLLFMYPERGLQNIGWEMLCTVRRTTWVPRTLLNLIRREGLYQEERDFNQAQRMIQQERRPIARRKVKYQDRTVISKELGNNIKRDAPYCKNYDLTTKKELLSKRKATGTKGFAHLSKKRGALAIRM